MRNRKVPRRSAHKKLARQVDLNDCTLPKRPRITPAERYMAYRTRDLLLIGLLGVVSCRDPFAVSDCPDDVEITVSAGTTPEIDWTPRCHLAVLSLVSEYERSNVWSISGRRHDYTCADNTGCASPLNTLYPPIRYNVVPRDAFQDFPISGQ